MSARSSKYNAVGAQQVNLKSGYFKPKATSSSSGSACGGVRLLIVGMVD